MIERPRNPTPIAPAGQLAEQPMTTCRRVAFPDVPRRGRPRRARPHLPSERAVQESRPGLFAIETLLYPGLAGSTSTAFVAANPQMAAAPELSTTLGYFHLGPLS